MSISTGEGKDIDGLGRIYSSILLENDDVGTSSLSVNLIFIKPNVDVDPYILELIPKIRNKDNSIKKESTSATHVITLDKLLSKFSNIDDYFSSIDHFEVDYLDLLKSKDPESLRSVIELKIKRSRTLNKSKELTCLSLIRRWS